MASGTGVRSAGRSRNRGSAPTGPQPPERGPDPSASGAPHLRARTAQGGAFRLQRLVLLEIAAAAVVVGWAVLDESLGWTVVAGTGLVCAGVFLVNRSPGAGLGASDADVRSRNRQT